MEERDLVPVLDELLNDLKDGIRALATEPKAKASTPIEIDLRGSQRERISFD